MACDGVSPGGYVVGVERTWTQPAWIRVDVPEEVMPKLRLRGTGVAGIYVKGGGR